MQVNTEDIIERLIEKDIRPSHYRIRILQYLHEDTNHPTVDQIYTALKDELPTLSKTTIYNTLSLFKKSDLLTRFTYDDNEAQYDLRTNEHGHFKCEECEKLYDFEFKFGDCVNNELNGFIINSKDVYFKGICKECLKNSKK